jgi:hypothetical protein
MKDEMVKITLSEADLNNIIWGLTAIKTIRLPVDPEWKIPYESTLKSLKKIQEEVVEIKRVRRIDNAGDSLGDEAKIALGDSARLGCD